MEEGLENADADIRTLFLRRHASKLASLGSQGPELIIFNGYMVRRRAMLQSKTTVVWRLPPMPLLRLQQQGRLANRHTPCTISRHIRSNNPHHHYHLGKITLTMRSHEHRRLAEKRQRPGGATSSPWSRQRFFISGGGRANDSAPSMTSSCDYF